MFDSGDITDVNSLVLNDSGSNNITFRANTTIDSSYTLTFPDDDGASFGCAAVASLAAIFHDEKQHLYQPLCSRHPRTSARSAAWSILCLLYQA